MLLHMLLLSAGLAVAFAVTAEEVIRSEWQAFKTKHDRNYTSAHEELLRFKIFTENSLFIARHNEKYVRGLVSYSLGINQFGDMLHHEFLQLTNCYKRSDASSGRSTYLPPENVDGSDLPQSVDWRKKGYVTPVKNQGQCGSCWAFSATGSLEGQHFRKTGKLVSLSEQNLVDCSRDYGNNGCNGGTMENAFDYVKANGGIDTEKSYPYHGLDEECKFKKADVGATATGRVSVKQGSEEDLRNAVATVGPVSVAIDASRRSFQFYKKGIVVTTTSVLRHMGKLLARKLKYYVTPVVQRMQHIHRHDYKGHRLTYPGVYDEQACSSTKLDHGVLAVGYGVLNGTKYWLVKNSWAEEWGEKGYIYMSRDKNNQCGIATDATYPLV